MTYLAREIHIKFIQRRGTYSLIDNFSMHWPLPPYLKNDNCRNVVFIVIEN